MATVRHEATVQAHGHNLRVVATWDSDPGELADHGWVNCELGVDGGELVAVGGYWTDGCGKRTEPYGQVEADGAHGWDPFRAAIGATADDEVAHCLGEVYDAIAPAIEELVAGRMASEWTIPEWTDPLELAYRRDDAQGYECRRLMVEWSSRKIWVGTKSSSEHAVTMDEHHGHVTAWRLPPTVDATRLGPWLREDAQRLLLERVAAGYESVWDGHNHVAQLTEDAQAAYADWDVLMQQVYEEPGRLELELLDGAGVWAAEDWLYYTRHELGVTADSSDEQLAEIAAKLEREARGEQVVLEGAEEYLRTIREELRDGQ